MALAAVRELLALLTRSREYAEPGSTTAAERTAKPAKRERPGTADALGAERPDITGRKLRRSRGARGSHGAEPPGEGFFPGMVSGWTGGGDRKCRQAEVWASKVGSGEELEFVVWGA